MSIGIVSFLVGMRSYRFKEPLMLDEEMVDGKLCLRHHELGLIAYGSSWGECDTQIREQLARLWENFVFTAEETKVGITQKERLLNMVEED